MPRSEDRVVYHRRCLLWYGILLFTGKLGSRRQLDFKCREAGASVLDNLNRLAQAEQDSLPCNDTLNDFLALTGAAPIASLLSRIMNRLIRGKVLDSARVQGRLVMGMEGSGCLVFRWRHCEHCLTRQCGDHTLYCHQVLEAKILGPAEMVLSLGSEFIDNRDQADLPVQFSHSSPLV